MAILEAAARQFVERGYDRFSIEGVAAEAGAGKQTIYRWWGSKGELIADCLLEGRIITGPVDPPDTGDLRADLTAWLSELFEILQRSGGEDLIRSLSAAAAESATVGQRIRAGLGATSVLAERLRAAIRDGQLDAGTSLEEFSDILVGAVLLRALARVEEDADAARRLVEAILGPPGTVRVQLDR